MPTVKQRLESMCRGMKIGVPISQLVLEGLPSRLARWPRRYSYRHVEEGREGFFGTCEARKNINDNTEVYGLRG